MRNKKECKNIGGNYRSKGDWGTCDVNNCNVPDRTGVSVFPRSYYTNNNSNTACPPGYKGVGYGGTKTYMYKNKTDCKNAGGAYNNDYGNGCHFSFCKGKEVVSRIMNEDEKKFAIKQFQSIKNTVNRVAIADKIFFSKPVKMKKFKPRKFKMPKVPKWALGRI